MKRHDVDLVSLVFGVVFCLAAGGYFASHFLNVRWDFPNGGWIVAGALILLGVLGIGASLRSHRDTEDT
jgi:hypothetical protein